MDREVNNVDDMAILEKKEQLLRRLQEREEERLSEQSKRKEEAGQQSSAIETADYFEKTFEKNVVELRDSIDNTPSVAKDQLSDHFDELSQKLITLQKFLTDSSFFLSGRQLEQNQSVLNSIQVDIANAREKYIPKKKFAFKNKKKQAPTAVKDEVSRGEAQSVSDYNIAVNEYRINDKSDIELVIAENDVKDKDVVVSKIENCNLSIKGVPTAIHLSDCFKSTVISGPCARSIFIERCKDCTLVLACQQLRIHEATNCTFYIHVTSKAIIEDSRELKFSTYSLQYDSLDQHYVEAGLNRSINNWAEVDDFNWLVRDKQSPNWSKLPEGERKAFRL